MDTTAPTEADPFDLDLSIVASTPAAASVPSADCTSDNCGGTNDSAGVTC